MKRSIAALLCLSTFAVAGCASHVVKPRNAGRVDSARSISSSSEAEWTVRRAPTAEPDEER